MENQFIQQVNTFRTLQVHKAGYIDQELGGIAVTADQVTMQSIQLVNTAGMGGLEGQITYASEPVDVAIRIDALGVTVTTQPDGTFLIPYMPQGTYIVTIFPTNDPANMHIVSVTIPGSGIYYLVYTI